MKFHTLAPPAEQILNEGIENMRAKASKRDVEQERSMAATVRAFNAIYGTDLTEEQGWAFMILLKMKRASTGKFDADDYVDGSAYFGLLGEAAFNKHETQIIEAES